MDLPNGDLGPHINDQLAAYLDGALPVAQARAVTAHLAACASCRAEVAAQRALDQQFHAWGGVDPYFAQVPYGARQALRAHLALVPAPQTRASGMRTAWAMASGVAAILLLLVAGGLFAPAGGKVAEATPSRWSTFVVGGGPAPVFSLDYPSDWSLTQASLAPPSMTINLRFSTYKPPVGGALTALGENDAEIWLAVGKGTLEEGWAAVEMAGLRTQGYQERAYRLGILSAVRLTDTAPHFGVYDAVYVPLGDQFTARAYLSATAARYVSTFDTMLNSFQVVSPATATPAAAAQSAHPVFLRSQSETGGTSSVCGTQDFLESQAASQDASQVVNQDASQAASQDSAPLGYFPDEDICVNPIQAKKTQ